MAYLQKRLESMRYAFEGLKDIINTQANAKIHIGATLLVLGAGLYFQLDKVEWCLILLCITLVFSAESINTAIESLTDLVSPDFHPLAKRTKDAAAAGVLCTAIGAFLIGLIVFFPKILLLFNG